MQIDAHNHRGLRLPQSRAVVRLASLIAPPVAPSQRFTWQFLAVVAVCVMLMMSWRNSRHSMLGLHDLYPLYFGAKAWLAHGNAYELATVAPIQDQQHGIVITGNAYPLLAVLLVLPLSLLSPHTAAVVWIGVITTALLLALRLYGSSCWLIAYWPLLEAIRLEQYTAFVILAQLIALWAYRERHPWLLGLACTLALTKPTQGVFFVAALLVLTSDRIRPLSVIAALWSGTILLDPAWPWEWIGGLSRYQEIAQHPYLWQLALGALPLLLLRRSLGAAIAASYSLFRFPLPSPYMASMLPLAVIDDRRAIWLVPFSYLWWPLAAYFGYAWGIALAFFFPVLLLAMRQWYEQHQARRVEPDAAQPLGAT